jgi:hypothetical protein
MYKTSFSYVEEGTGEAKTITYAEAFVEAAKLSGVSPYHLATRVKQEVVTSSTAFSSSASGTFSGYEGYYNFYNIGATHSTETNGAIINGLTYAKGTKATETTKSTYMLPWDNPYKAIVGGAIYIGKQYINKGQNTIYLQKFNVTTTSTYSHQYMANVEAANSESTKLYNGFASMLDSMPIVFNIPIYTNMPDTSADIPTTIANPNNWLKTLKLGTYTLTPAFSAKDGGKTAYTLDLSSSTAASLNLTATPVYSKATVEVKVKAGGKETSLGKGTSSMVPISDGTTVVSVIVTAEDGTTNTYTITITK